MSYLSQEENTNERGRSLRRGCVLFFFCLLHNSQEILYRLFSCWVHSDPPLLSLHLTELMSRSGQTWAIFTSCTSVILQNLSVQVILEWQITLLFRLRENANSVGFFSFENSNSIMIELLLRPCLPHVGLWMNAIVLYSSQQSDVEQAQQDGGLTTWHWQTEKHPHQRGTKAVYTRFSSGQTHFQHNVDVGLPLCTVECTSVMLQCCSIACCWLYHAV